MIYTEAQYEQDVLRINAEAVGRKALLTKGMTPEVQERVTRFTANVPNYLDNFEVAREMGKYVTLLAYEYGYILPQE